MDITGDTLGQSTEMGQTPPNTPQNPRIGRGSSSSPRSPEREENRETQASNLLTRIFSYSHLLGKQMHNVGLTHALSRLTDTYQNVGLNESQQYVNAVVKFGGGAVASLLLIGGLSGHSLLPPVTSLGLMFLWEGCGLLSAGRNYSTKPYGQVKDTALFTSGSLPLWRGVQTALTLLLLKGVAAHFLNGAFFASLIVSSALVGTGVIATEIFNWCTGEGKSHAEATPEERAQKRAEFLGMPYSLLERESH